MLMLATSSSALRSMALRAAATTSAGAQKRVLVPIADGSEEIETSCITDTLVRAGAEVTVASVEATTTCTMSRGLKIVADALVTDVSGDDWDLVALPGGMPGAERLRDSDALDAILRKQDARQAPLAAVCASPAVIPVDGVGLVMRSSSIRRLLSLLFAVWKNRSSYAAIARSDGLVPCPPPPLP